MVYKTQMVSKIKLPSNTYTLRLPRKCEILNIGTRMALKEMTILVQHWLKPHSIRGWINTLENRSMIQTIIPFSQMQCMDYKLQLLIVVYKELIIFIN
jgi:hypothetical protein